MMKMDISLLYPRIMVTKVKFQRACRDMSFGLANSLLSKATKPEAEVATDNNLSLNSAIGLRYYFH